MDTDPRLIDGDEAIGVLADMWLGAVRKRAAAVDGRFWDGCIAGTAAAIAVVSGIPRVGGIGIGDAISAGSEIARARLVAEGRWQP
jgi:hypothetical protein